jgi:hypothetical protein
MEDKLKNMVHWYLKIEDQSRILVYIRHEVDYHRYKIFLYDDLIICGSFLIREEDTLINERLHILVESLTKEALLKMAEIKKKIIKEDSYYERL